MRLLGHSLSESQIALHCDIGVGVAPGGVVGVVVGLFVGVLLGVPVGVFIGVSVGVPVNVGVSVAVGVGEAMRNVSVHAGATACGLDSGTDGATGCFWVSC